MYRRFKTSLYCLTLLPAIALPADPGTLAQFRCLASGHWDNVAQAEADIAAGQAESNRHPRRAMTYVPVRNPHLDGQLFAILNYTERGFDGPLQRVSLHRFRWSADDQQIVHEFFFLKDVARWGDLAADLGPLTRIRDRDVRVNESCAMYWRWQGDHFEGATRAGQCITSSFTEEPILVEGHGKLWPDKLVRHDQNYTLQGAAIAIPGGASQEVFDKLAVPPAQPPGLSAQIAAISVRPDCPH